MLRIIIIRYRFSLANSVILFFIKVVCPVMKFPKLFSSCGSSCGIAVSSSKDSTRSSSTSMISF